MNNKNYPKSQKNNKERNRLKDIVIFVVLMLFIGLGSLGISTALSVHSDSSSSESSTSSEITLINVEESDIYF